MRKAQIFIKGPKARLSGAPIEAADGVLAVASPGAKNSKAYKEGRWDGMVRLYDGCEFPAGLALKVYQCLSEQDFDVKVLESKEHLHAPDLERFTRDYLPGITLWDHQYEATLALIQSRRGITKVPTGGGKTEILACVGRFFWEEYGWRTLCITSRRDLISQTVDRLAGYYEGDLRVGQAGDGVKDVEGAHVVVGSAQTLLGYKTRVVKQRKSRKNPRGGQRRVPADLTLRQMLQDVEVLVLDEAHHASSDSWYEIAEFCGAKRRYGMSGTPLKDEELADARMIGSTGQIVYEVDAEELIALGLCARPKIAMVCSQNASGPDLPKVNRVITNPRTGQSFNKQTEMPYAQAYTEGIVENEVHHEAVMKAVLWLVDQKRKVLLITRRKAHYLRMAELLEEAGVAFVAAWGDTETVDRKAAKADFVQGGADVMLATTIFDEGTDVPGIDALVLAEGVKVNTNVLQRIGRGMRRKDGDNDVWVIDFIAYCHPVLEDHGLKRCQTYENEGYEVTLVEDWPAPGVEFEKDLLPFV